MLAKSVSMRLLETVYNPNLTFPAGSSDGCDIWMVDIRAATSDVKGNVHLKRRILN